jgi:hypothetical protein
MAKYVGSPKYTGLRPCMPVAVGFILEAILQDAPQPRRLSGRIPAAEQFLGHRRLVVVAALQSAASLVAAAGAARDRAAVRSQTVM